PIFNRFIDVDLKDPKRYTVYVTQAGLGLPDRDYYLKPEFKVQKQAYQTYVAKLIHLLNWPDGDARAKDVVDFETRIAQVSWTKAQQRDPIATYNPMSIVQLEKFAPGFAWRPFLREAGLSKLGRIVVAEKTAFPKIAQVYATTPLDTLRAWAAFNVADNAAVYLAKPFDTAYFELHQKTLAGQQQEEVRWKR